MCDIAAVNEYIHNLFNELIFISDTYFSKKH